ncbi:hypothetical protein ACTG9Q_15420 [Actinokineospora sp. 24-640]
MLNGVAGATTSAISTVGYNATGELVYNGTSVVDRVTINYNANGTKFIIRDDHQISPLAGGKCASHGTSGQEVACDLPSSARPVVHLNLGDGDDFAAVAVIAGGSVFGGSGNDHFKNSARDGFAFQYFGGIGRDTIDYSFMGRPVMVHLDNTANDGPIGRQDDIRSDVENIWGSTGPDVLVGNPTANTIEGGPGADTIDGGDGSDVLKGSGAGFLESVNEADDIVCGNGVDTLHYGSSDFWSTHDCEIRIFAPQ